MQMYEDKHGGLTCSHEQKLALMLTTVSYNANCEECIRYEFYRAMRTALERIGKKI